MGIGLAIGAAALVGAGATAYAASSAADSQSEANKANSRNVADTNANNYRMFLESRGSKGNSLLPNYFGPSTETTLSNRALQTYLAEQAALGSPEEQMRRNQEYAARYAPAMAQGDQLVNQLFNGQLEQQQVDNIAPVLAARGGVAKAQKEGILEGIMQRLNALSADRARSGYSGGGSALQKNLLVGTTIPELQAAATVGAQADLANATDVANIRNGSIATRLANLNLPVSQATSRINLDQLPGAATSRAYTTSLQPFDWFKLNPQAFQAAQAPLVAPVPGVGQIAGSAIASGASNLGNYFAYQALANQQNQGNPGFTVGNYLQNQRMVNQGT